MAPVVVLEGARRITVCVGRNDVVIGSRKHRMAGLEKCDLVAIEPLEPIELRSSLRPGCRLPFGIGAVARKLAFTLHRMSVNGAEFRRGAQEPVAARP